MVAGLEGVFKGRLSAWVSLAPSRASQAAGQDIQGHFYGKWWFFFFFFCNCIRSGGNARLPPGTIQQWAQREPGAASEPVPHCVLLGLHSHLQHPPSSHLSSEPGSPPFPKTGSELAFPQILPDHLYYTLSQHLQLSFECEKASSDVPNSYHFFAPQYIPRALSISCNLCNKLGY